MASLINKRNWWIVPVIGGILAIVVIVIQQTWLPANGFEAFLIAIAILGIAFYWAYTIDKKGLWWALIPALVMVVLLATGTVAYYTPTDASGSSPFGVVTLGLGAAILGWVFKRPSVKIVFYMIGMITLLFGILMLPVDLIWKIVLIVAEVALIGYLAWQTNRRLNKK